MKQRLVTALISQLWKLV